MFLFESSVKTIFSVIGRNIWYIHIDGLMQDGSISSALVIEILQSCNKPLIYVFWQYVCCYICTSICENNDFSWGYFCMWTDRWIIQKTDNSITTHAITICAGDNMMNSTKIVILINTSLQDLIQYKHYVYKFVDSANTHCKYITSHKTDRSWLTSTYQA